MSRYPLFFVYTFVIWLLLAFIIVRHHFGNYFASNEYNSQQNDKEKSAIKIANFPPLQSIPNVYLDKKTSESVMSVSSEIDSGSISLPPRQRDVQDINKSLLQTSPRGVVDRVNKSFSSAKVRGTPSNQNSPTNFNRANSKNKKKDKRIQDYLTKDSKGHGLSWTKFVSLKNDYPVQNSVQLNEALINYLDLRVCGDDLVKTIKTPALTDNDYKWCQWALSSKGGNVQVGKSYGTLNGPDRNKYEQLSCNTVAKSKNPSCDDAWGDEYLKSWKRNTASDLCGDTSKFTSKLHCSDSSSTARFCAFENVLFDFSKMSRVKRPGRSDSRKWDKGFLASHCSADKADINFYQFYGPMVDPSTTKCDYVFNETVLAYSHDDIQNLGHSMSDIMNVWAMLWLSGMGSYSQDITFFNIDALRMGHSYDDQLSQFGRHYEVSFGRLFKAVNFAEQGANVQGRSTVCFKRLIFQPIPLILFTWDGWWQDMKCSFVGPSSLFQRWNLQLRSNYNLLHPDHLLTKETVQVLLIVRRLGRDHSSMYTSRIFGNEGEIVAALRSVPGVKLVVQDLAVLSFEQQVRLIGNASLIIGMHGAGIANSMHMPIGTKYCCGVIEIFPLGEFSQIRGYGNMARRMGHHYERIMLNGDDGSKVATPALLDTVNQVLRKIREQPTCVLPTVLGDPYFDSVKGGFSLSSDER